jgi:hypothetical protein
MQDQLLCDFSEELLSKVEVYTFGSAANHFSRPSATAYDTPISLPFARVEHFANEDDFVAQFGVLGNAPDAPSGNNDGVVPVLQGTFGGRIFKRRKTAGHLLLAHYLYESDSILNDPIVQEHSTLATYLGGSSVAPAPVLVST